MPLQTTGSVFISMPGLPTMNWSWLYEILERIRNITQIILANPYKVKLISEAQIKPDKIDAAKGT